MRSEQSKSVGFIFLHTFQMNGMKYLKLLNVMKQFKWIILRLRDVVIQGTWLVLLTALKKKQNNFNIGMHSNIYKPIWFKLGVVMDTAVLCIFILVYVILTLIHGHRDARDLESKTVSTLIISQSYVWI